MQRSNMTGIIFTVYAEVTWINNLVALRYKGRRANLPIYEIIVSILETSPGIRSQHAKYHGFIRMKPQRTREQLENYYAYRIAKGREDDWADHHIRWSMCEIETIVMQRSSWHWLIKNWHLLFQPIYHLSLHKNLDLYLIVRKIYIGTRGADEK